MKGETEGEVDHYKNKRKHYCPHLSAHNIRATNLVFDYLTLQNTNLSFSMICVVGPSLSQ